METPRSRLAPLMSWVLILLLLACVVEILLLVRQNRSLRADVATWQARAAAREVGPALGQPAPALDVLTTDGATESLSFAGGQSPTLILVASADCPSCNDTLPYWKAIAAKAPPNLRAFALTLENPTILHDHFAGVGLDWPVYAVPRGEAANRWRLVEVPITILIAPTGTVTRVWSGSLTDETTAEVLLALKEAGATG